MSDESDKPVTETPAEKAAAAEDRVARSRSRRASAADEDDIAPKLPRGSGFKISKGHVIKIVLTASLLVMLIVIQRPCANAVSSFVTSFDEQGSDAKKVPKPGTVDRTKEPQYELIRGDMTEAEQKAAIERAMKKAGTGSSDPNAGSAATGSGSGAGSASR